ncbi:MAG: DNA polymerase IV [Dehalococcoidia bacterium]
MPASPSYKYILHADLDAFYASVEQLDNPALKGKPVAVGGSPSGRGVVAAASYEAREFGVRSAMPMRTALGLCPELIRISPRFDRYQEVSGQVMQIFRNLTPLVEPISMDEAFLDIGDQSRPDTVNQVATRLKSTVWRQTALTLTIGGGTSKTVAKIASQVAKPDGLLLVRPGEESDFLAPLDVEMLWGVGPKSAEVLRGHDVNTIGDVVNLDEAWLRNTFGKRGPELKERALGLDHGPVTPHRETKSVSAETTMARDISDESVLRRQIRELAEDVAARLHGEELKGKTIHVKLRLADFTTFTRQTTLPTPTDDVEIIFRTAWELTQPELAPRRKFRLLGVGASNFQTVFQLALVPPA